MRSRVNDRCQKSRRRLRSCQVLFKNRNHHFNSRNCHDTEWTLTRNTTWGEVFEDGMEQGSWNGTDFRSAKRTQNSTVRQDLGGGGGKSPWQIRRLSSMDRKWEKRKTLVVHQHGGEAQVDLVVQPALGTADVAGHLVVLEPQADLVLGTLHGVAAVDDVPERSKRII